MIAQEDQVMTDQLLIRDPEGVKVYIPSGIPGGLTFFDSHNPEKPRAGDLFWDGETLSFTGDAERAAQIWVRAFAECGYWGGGVTIKGPRGCALHLRATPETRTVLLSLVGRLTPESAQFIGEVVRLLAERMETRSGTPEDRG